MQTLTMLVRMVTILRILTEMAQRISQAKTTMLSLPMTMRTALSLTRRSISSSLALKTKETRKLTLSSIANSQN